MVHLVGSAVTIAVVSGQLGYPLRVLSCVGGYSSCLPGLFSRSRLRLAWWASKRLAYSSCLSAFIAGPRRCVGAREQLGQVAGLVPGFHTTALVLPIPSGGRS